jgi:hypothetical protein
MTDSLAEQAPSGLSLAARREWHDQTTALVEAGLLTTARVALVTAWARSLDSRSRALEAWRAAGEPQTELGSKGQQRASHLRVAVTRAEAELAVLSGKLERSVARRPPKRSDGLPPGARRVEIDGEAAVLREDGRLIVRSVVDGRWLLDAFEQDADDAAMLRWLGDDGLPRFHDVPPWRLPSGGGRAEPLPWPEVEEWAGRVAVPLDAAKEWYERVDRAPSRITFARRATLDDMLGGS